MQTRFHTVLVAGCVALASLPSVALATDLTTVYEPYAELLDRFVTEKNAPADGLVSAFDYDAALAHDATGALLDRQHDRLAAVDVDTLDTKAEATAFWLNAYNYFMIAHILQNPQDGELIESVRDYGSWYNPYRVFSQDHFAIGGEHYSLDEMEKGILLGDDFKERGWFDARVHFAVNCASVGCPPLRDALYTADNVDDLLVENTRKALNTPRHLHVDGDTLYLTELFDWYADDYKYEADSVKDWIRAHGDAETVARVDAAERVRYIDYDWTLNAPDYFPEFNGSEFND